MTKEDEELVSAGLDDLVPVTLVEDSECANGGFNCSLSPNNGTHVDEELELDVTKITVLSLITILTVLGNVCVILAILCRQQKMTRMYYFILHLSLADLLTAFFTIFPEIIWTMTFPYFYGGDFVCKAVKVLQMIGPYLSSYVLIMTAIDRYQAICHPLSNCTWTPRRSNIMISVAWIISILLCIPQALVFHGHDENFCTAHFSGDWGLKTYVTWFAFSNFFVPFIFLIFCYGRICWTIWDNFNSKTCPTDTNDGKGKKLLLRLRQITSRVLKKPTKLVNHDDKWSTQGGNVENRNEAQIIIEPPSSPGDVALATEEISRAPATPTPKLPRKASTDSSSSEENHVKSRPCSSQIDINPRTHSVQGISRAKIKTVKLTVVVILGYIFCSLPFICGQLWITWGSPSQAVVQSISWLFWLLTLNSVVNPWIYMFFNANLVQALYGLILCCPQGPQFRSELNRSRYQPRPQETAQGIKLLRTRSNIGDSTTEMTVTTSVLATVPSNESLRSSNEQIDSTNRLQNFSSRIQVSTRV